MMMQATTLLATDHIALLPLLPTASAAAAAAVTAAALNRWLCALTTLENALTKKANEARI
jgi:hypothetical protein